MTTESMSPSDRLAAIKQQAREVYAQNLLTQIHNWQAPNVIGALDAAVQFAVDAASVRPNPDDVRQVEAVARALQDHKNRTGVLTHRGNNIMPASYDAAREALVALAAVVGP